MEANRSRSQRKFKSFLMEDILGLVDKDSMRDNSDRKAENVQRNSLQRPGEVDRSSYGVREIDSFRSLHQENQDAKRYEENADACFEESSDNESPKKGNQLEYDLINIVIFSTAQCYFAYRLLVTRGVGKYKLQNSSLIFTSNLATLGVNYTTVFLQNTWISPNLTFSIVCF